LYDKNIGSPLESPNARTHNVCQGKKTFKYVILVIKDEYSEYILISFTKERRHWRSWSHSWEMQQHLEAASVYTHYCTFSRISHCSIECIDRI